MPALFAVVLTAAFLLGCEESTPTPGAVPGDVGPGPSDAAARPVDTEPVAPRADAGSAAADPCDEAVRAPMPLRRVTREGWRRAVRTLLGAAVSGELVDAAAARLAPDAIRDGFDNQAEAQAPTAADIDGWWEGAASIARAVTRDTAAVATLMGCALPEAPAEPPRVEIRGGALGGDGRNQGAFRTLFSPGAVTGSAELSAGGAIEASVEVSADVDATVELLIDDRLRLTTEVPAGRGGETLTAEPVALAAGPVRLEARIAWAGEGAVRVAGFSLVGPLPDTWPPEPVEPEAALTACAPAWIETLAAAVERGGAPPPEVVERWQVLFDDATRDAGVHAGAEAVLMAALLSPQLIYVRGDSDGAGGAGQAARMAHLLWRDLPDERLMAAAAGGALDTDAGRREAAAWMVEDPRARDVLVDFHAQWLGLRALDDLERGDRDEAVAPDFDAALAAAMRAETERVVERVLWGGGDFAELWTTTATEADARLARVYGATVVDDGRPHPVELDPGERSGLLTHASVLTMTARRDQTSPVHRGAWVRARLLCDAPPPPPGDLQVVPPAPDPEATTRERWARHSSDPACAGCHRLIDPIGFLFEGYDPVGGVRAMDGRHPVDTQGEVPGVADLAGPFDGAVALAHALAESETARACYAGWWFRYATGRPAEGADACTLRALEAALAERPLREALLEIVATPAFDPTPPTSGDGR